MGLIDSIFNEIVNFVKKNPKAAIGIGLGVGGGVAGGIGIFQKLKGDRINKEAIEIRERAIAKYEKSKDEAQAQLEVLGNLKLKVAESFDDFASAIGSIQRYPRGLIGKIKGEDLSAIRYDELKALSNNARITIESVGSAAIGAIAGAAFGMQLAILGPAAFLGGVVLCIKGVNLKNKAIKNKQEAEQLSKDVDSVVVFLSDLESSTQRLHNSMNMISDRYFEYLQRIRELVNRSTNWKSYSRKEKLLIKNTIRLVDILNKMCKVKLINKPARENEIETVNEREINAIMIEGTKIFKEYAIF